MPRIFFILFFTPLFLAAQTTPKEGSALNYRIIGFSFPPGQEISSYKVQVALGNYSGADSFEKNIVVSVAAETNKIIAEVPAFGKQYTWRFVSTDHSKTSKSDFHHFSTMMSPDVNPDSVRLRIIDSAVKYKDSYVFVDGNKVLYDMKGQPVWFFPPKDNLSPGPGHLRDMKLTPFGTITFIIDENIYEMAYNGDILWKGPGNNKIPDDSTSIDVYHHEFTRLKNGHYMTMAFEQVLWKMPLPIDSNLYLRFHGKIIRDSNNVYYQKMLFGTILEYDEKGNTVWKWSGSDYFKKSDLASRTFDNGIINLIDTHANAFYFDEKTKTILISFRDVDRVIKIQYPSGKVLETYGKRYTPDMSHERHIANGVFCGQHSCRLSSDGNLYLFNNNICRRRAAPTILVLKEPGAGKDTIEKIWEFECPVYEPGELAQSTTIFNFGGSVSELPDHSFFVCMGGLYGKTFIVNRDKNILWSGQPEKWDDGTKSWAQHGMLINSQATEGVYRASIISRKELESLIWGEGP